MALVSFFSRRRPVIIVAGLNGSHHSSPFDPFLIVVTHANLTVADWQDGACLQEVKRSIFFLQTAHWWCQEWYIDKAAGKPTLKKECF